VEEPVVEAHRSAPPDRQLPPKLAGRPAPAAARASRSSRSSVRRNCCAAQVVLPKSGVPLVVSPISDPSSLFANRQPVPRPLQNDAVVERRSASRRGRSPFHANYGRWHRGCHRFGAAVAGRIAPPPASGRRRSTHALHVRFFPVDRRAWKAARPPGNGTGAGGDCHTTPVHIFLIRLSSYVCQGKFPTLRSRPCSAPCALPSGRSVPRHDRSRRPVH
jgi:hypothetical protein